MAGKLTMAEIAKELGVSRCAVSAVINDRVKKQGIAESTAQRIRDHLKARGYVRARSAMQLRDGKQGGTDVAIIYSGEFLKRSDLVQASYLLTQGIKVLHGRAEMICVDAENTHGGLEELLAQQVRRVIWMHANPPEVEMGNALLLQPLLAQMDRVIIYNYDFLQEEAEKDYRLMGIDLIGSDREGAYRDLAKRWRRAGHERVALNESRYAQGSALSDPTRPLERIFMEEGFSVFGLKPDEIGGDEEAALLQHMLDLRRYQRVKCGFVRSDYRAAALLDGLRKNGVQVPEDLAVWGFGGLPFGAWLPVPLSSFAAPVEDMCAQTLKLLKRKKTPRKGRSYRYDYQAVLRQSHG